MREEAKGRGSAGGGGLGQLVDLSSRETRFRRIFRCVGSPLEVVGGTRKKIGESGEFLCAAFIGLTGQIDGNALDRRH